MPTTRLEFIADRCWTCPSWLITTYLIVFEEMLHRLWGYENFKPVFWWRGAIKWSTFATSFSLHHLFFISGITGMIQEGHWLSKSDIKLNFTIILFDFNITNSFAHIIQILRWFNYILDQIWSFKQMFPISVLPKVKEVVFKQFHFPHQWHIFRFNINHFIF